MNDRFLSLLGLMRRAGKLTVGFDAVKESAVSGESRLIIITDDISQRSAKEITFQCRDTNVPIKQVKYSIEDIDGAIGCKVKIISINDDGFAKALTLIGASQEEKII